MSRKDQDVRPEGQDSLKRAAQKPRPFAGLVFAGAKVGPADAGQKQCVSSGQRLTLEQIAGALSRMPGRPDGPELRPTSRAQKRHSTLGPEPRGVADTRSRDPSAVCCPVPISPLVPKVCRENYHAGGIRLAARTIYHEGDERGDMGLRFFEPHEKGRSDTAGAKVESSAANRSSRNREPQFDCVLLTSSDAEFQIVSKIVAPAAIAVHHARVLDQADFLLLATAATVLLSDVAFGDGTWEDALEMLSRSHPAVPLLLAVQESVLGLWTDVKSGGVYDIVTKPFAADELRRSLASANGYVVWSRLRRHLDPLGLI